MAPRKKTRETVAQEEAAFDVPKLFNIASKGLGFYDANGKLIQVSDVSLKLIGK